MRGATFQEPRMTPRRWVSIHAPHARGDTLNKTYDLSSEVSIHAPHARGDLGSPRPCRRTPRFNPRPSCEGRLPPANSIDKSHVFQSTPLMRGATSDSSYGTPIELVSIHAPHARGDMRYWRVVARSQVSIHAPHARGDNFFSCALA